jgi:arsenate reductase (thioredoxin)
MLGSAQQAVRLHRLLRVVLSSGVQRQIQKAKMSFILVTFFTLLLPIVGYANSETVVDKSTVIFVCEHGSAKSVVAAAYFNRIAGDKKLGFRAVSRGITPDAELAQPAVKGLLADGIILPLEKPTKLTTAEASAALRVVSFCDLTNDIKGKTVQRWEAPPISEDYSKARDVIVRKVEDLIHSLQE